MEKLFMETQGQPTCNEIKTNKLLTKTEDIKEEGKSDFLADLDNLNKMLEFGAGRKGLELFFDENVKTEIEGFWNNCKECVYSGKSEVKLKIHTDIHHRGIRYNCDKCEHKATTKIHLYYHYYKNHESTGKPLKYQTSIICLLYTSPSPRD